MHDHTYHHILIIFPTHYYVFFSYHISASHFCITLPKLYCKTSNFLKLWDTCIYLFYPCLFHTDLFHLFCSANVDKIFFAQLGIFSNIAFWYYIFILLHTIQLLKHCILLVYIFWKQSFINLIGCISKANDIANSIIVWQKFCYLGII